MKKFLFLAMPLALAACSTPVQQSSVPMDMQAVEAYKQRVASGNTVNESQTEQWELNQSDKRKEMNIYHHYPQHSRIRPHIGYHHGRYHSGIGIGLGHY